MTLALLLCLGCAVHAEQAPVPDPSAEQVLEQAREGSARMLEIERSIAALSESELAQAREAALRLTSSCPYNGATLQIMGVLVAEVPRDSATREGVDAMARLMAQLQLDPGEHSVDASDQRMRGVSDQVAALSEQELASIDASLEAFQGYTGGEGSWPPNEVFELWRDQLQLEGHDPMAYLINTQLGNTC